MQPGNVGSDTQTHRVERVAVLAERVRDEAVVGRIDHRREQEAVELDGIALVVLLVLVAAPLGDLDDAAERSPPSTVPAQPTGRLAPDANALGPRPACSCQPLHSPPRAGPRQRRGPRRRDRRPASSPSSRSASSLFFTFVVMPRVVHPESRSRSARTPARPRELRCAHRLVAGHRFSECSHAAGAAGHHRGGRSLLAHAAPVPPARGREPFWEDSRRWVSTRPGELRAARGRRRGDDRPPGAAQRRRRAHRRAADRGLPRASSRRRCPRAGAHRRRRRRVLRRRRPEGDRHVRPAPGPGGRPARVHPPDPVRSRRSRRSRAGAWPAGSSWRCGATCASRPRGRRSASPSAAGASR